LRLLSDMVPDFVLTLQFIDAKENADHRVFRNVLRFCRSRLSAYIGVWIISAVGLRGLPLTSSRKYRLP